MVGGHAVTTTSRGVTWQNVLKLHAHAPLTQNPTPGNPYTNNVSIYVQR